MTPSRLVALGVPVLLVSAFLMLSPAQATSSPAGPVVAGRSVTVSETVPTVVKATVKGRKVSTKIARPVELQQLSGTAWKTVARSTSSMAGTRAFTYKASITTTLRVLAPRYTQTVKFKVKKTSTKVRVALKTYVSPARRITVTPHTQMVSRGLDGTSGDNYSGESDTDATGRYVVFGSYAENLVETPVNGRQNVYLRDTATGKTELVTLGVDGLVGDNDSRYPRISANGRFVVYESRADNLVDGPTNLNDDVFVWDRTTKKTELVSRKVGGGAADGPSTAAAVSGDGRYVVFVSLATNLMGYHDGSHTAVIYRRDLKTGFTTSVSWAPNAAVNGPSDHPSVDDSGQKVAFESSASNLVPGDTNGSRDIFLWNFETGLMSRVTRAGDDGPVNAASGLAAISGDGSRIAYESAADNIVADDDNDANDVFVFDVVSRKSALISRTPLGKPANGRSYQPDLDSRGSVVVFESSATDLVSGARGGQVYAYETGSRKVSLVSALPGGAVVSGQSSFAAVSGDGRRVSYSSGASGVVPGAVGYHVYVRDVP